MPLASQSRAKLRKFATRASSEAAFIGWSRTGSGRRNTDRLAALRGLYAGRRCFVMGNGPSLLRCDLNLLAAEVTLVSNAHFLIWDRLSYVPTFLAVEDALVAEDRGAELRALSGPTKLFPRDLRGFLGPPTDNTLYVNFPRLYQPFPKFSADISRRAYWGGTVSFLNLQLATYLGCNPIILIGFDHNYRVPEAVPTDSVIHSTADDVNHIHPDYFGTGYRWHDPNTQRMEAAYICAREALARRGVEVLNATVGGRLEIFPRVPFETVVGSGL